jgi:hypothetical protein
MKRAVCPACRRRPVAVNYKSKEKTYYRNRCDQCIRKNKQSADLIPSWVRSGYKKKDRCEKCNFKSRTLEQMFVWYVDNDYTNNNWANLKTVCANCKIELVQKKLIWEDPPIKADF